jgi:hypothetical protein
VTLAERGRMANAAYSAQRIERQRQLNELLADGVNLKRAAHLVGWSYRSARRWRA